MDTKEKMSMDEYNEIMSVVNQIEFAADEMKNDTVAELDKMVEKLAKVWQGEASDEYILRMKALRDRILNTVKSVYEAVENIPVTSNLVLMLSFFKSIFSCSIVVISSLIESSAGCFAKSVFERSAIPAMERL